MAKLKAGLLSLRDLLATAWWIVLITAIGFIVAFQYVKPAPPSHLVISAGGKSGAYEQFARRYAAILARNGITLEVRASSGSLENLERLEKGEVDVAFIQGGVTLPKEDEEEGLFAEAPVQSLGSVFYEPVWVFYRGSERLTRLTQLKGKRLAIGEEGSGVRQLARQLLAANDLEKDAQLLPLAGLKAAEELQQGRIDAAFVIAAQEAPVVQVLLRSPGVRVMSFTQAEAYQRRFPFLNRLIMPEGVADLVRNFPPSDIELLAPTANLAVRGDLHPALQGLLLQAAAEVHGQSGFFQKAGEFPAYKDRFLPLSPEAARYYKSGPPFLERFLPFWLATLMDRLVVLLVPLFALLIPLLKVAPAVYAWRVKSKVFRCYGELKFLENDIKQDAGAERLAEYHQRLETIEDEASALPVPLAFTDLIYTLREHINLVRRTLVKLEQQKS